MKTYIEPQRELPVRADVDILVVGGGPSGVMAARAAAQSGKKVMLIESRGYLGGNLTLGLPILAYLDVNGKQCIKGYAQEMIDRLAERGCAGPHVPCKNHMSLTIIDPDEVKSVLLEMVQERGVEVLMYVFCSAAIMEGNTIKGVIIESKAGREVIFAKTVIDCTGDGDVATRAGVEMHKGDENGGMQPPTLMYSVRKVDMARFRDALVNHRDVFDMDVMPPEQFAKRYFITVGLRNQIKQANAAGLDIPVARTILITGLKDDQIWVNMSRVSGVDSTLPESYTFGEIEARRQMYRINEYLRKYVPGFENLEVEKVAPFLGIRESRVMVGKYVLTAEDILTSRRFEDVITVAGVTTKRVTVITPFLVILLVSALVFLTIAAFVIVGGALLFGFSLGTWFIVGMILLACGYVLYDTSNIMLHYPEEADVLATVELFASLMTLFYYILSLLSSRDN